MQDRIQVSRERLETGETPFRSLSGLPERSDRTERPPHPGISPVRGEAQTRRRKTEARPTQPPTSPTSPEPRRVEPSAETRQVFRARLVLHFSSVATRCHC